jgi:hypothetical protein
MTDMIEKQIYKSYLKYTYALIYQKTPQVFNHFDGVLIGTYRLI